jgi:predicted metal-dependent HD superfamily phosphohydrolase
MPSLERWLGLWDRLGGVRPEFSLYDELLARYSEAHRRYHTIQHLDECLAHLAQLEADAIHPERVEVALWFHDVVYDPKRSDNEAKSADWCRAVVSAAGLDAAIGDAVHALVMATRHDAVPNDQDERVLVDVDLSILGADRPRFDEYEQQVREEYAWVPDIMFRSKRRAILQAILDRPRIFRSNRFFVQYEARARDNLRRSIAQLEA